MNVVRSSWEKYGRPSVIYQRYTPPSLDKAVEESIHLVLGGTFQGRLPRGKVFTPDIKILPAKPERIFYYGKTYNYLDTLKRRGYNPRQRRWGAFAVYNLLKCLLIYRIHHIEIPQVAPCYRHSTPLECGRLDTPFL